MTRLASAMLAATFLLLAGGSTLPMAQAAAAKALDVSAAINKAGRLRMLSQRLAKAWVMTGMGIAPGDASRILADSQARFETQLAELKTFTPSYDVNAAHARVEREWNGYRAALAAVPRPDNSQRVYELSETLQNAAHQLTLAYEKAARGPAERLINIAGRQRMLSQRMAKYYLFRAWGVNPVAAQMELNFARAEFSSGMHQLYNAPSPDPEIRRTLERLDGEWMRYRERLAAARDVATYRHDAPLVAEQSEQILEIIETLVEHYEQQTRLSP